MEVGFGDGVVGVGNYLEFLVLVGEVFFPVFFVPLAVGFFPSHLSACVFVEVVVAAHWFLGLEDEVVFLFHAVACAEVALGERLGYAVALIVDGAPKQVLQFGKSLLCHR